MIQCYGLFVYFGMEIKVILYNIIFGISEAFDDLNCTDFSMLIASELPSLLRTFTS